MNSTKSLGLRLHNSSRQLNPRGYKKNALNLVQLDTFLNVMICINSLSHNKL